MTKQTSKRKVHIGRNLALVVLMLLLSTSVLAQSSGQYDLTWNVISNGGGTSSGTRFSVSGTIGQALTESSSGSRFTLGSGFWGPATSSSPSCPRPITDVSITGSTLGLMNKLYTFTAVVVPSDATTPIVYTWNPAPQSGQSTASASYTWDSLGAKSVAVTIENCDGSYNDNTSHTITIKETLNFVYLPLILR